jgi:hypothetical protein
MKKFEMGEAIKADTEVIELLKKKGVKIYDMSTDDFKAWLEVSQKTAWKRFAEKVKGGKELIIMKLGWRGQEDSSLRPADSQVSLGHHQFFTIFPNAFSTTI